MNLTSNSNLINELYLRNSFDLINEILNQINDNSKSYLQIMELLSKKHDKKIAIVWIKEILSNVDSLEEKLDYLDSEHNVNYIDSKFSDNCYFSIDNRVFSRNFCYIIDDVCTLNDQNVINNISKNSYVLKIIINSELINEIDDINSVITKLILNNEESFKS